MGTDNRVPRAPDASPRRRPSPASGCPSGRRRSAHRHGGSPPPRPRFPRTPRRRPPAAGAPPRSVDSPDGPRPAARAGRRARFPRRRAAGQARAREVGIDDVEHGVEQPRCVQWLGEHSTRPRRRVLRSGERFETLAIVGRAHEEDRRRLLAERQQTPFNVPSISTSATSPSAGRRGQHPRRPRRRPRDRTARASRRAPSARRRCRRPPAPGALNRVRHLEGNGRDRAEGRREAHGRALPGVLSTSISPSMYSINWRVIVSPGPYRRSGAWWIRRPA